MTRALTKPQRVTLMRIASLNDAGHVANSWQNKLNKGLLERLLGMGLITSDVPFMYQFHAVRITPAGRQALIRSTEPQP